MARPSSRKIDHAPMFISLNWIRDFVDLPASLNAREMAERFTVTTAEVEGIEEIRGQASGLVGAQVRSVEPGDGQGLSLVRLFTGKDEIQTVTHAKDLKAGVAVVYAPPGARLLNQMVNTRPVQVSGRAV